MNRKIVFGLLICISFLLIPLVASQGYVDMDFFVLYCNRQFDDHNAPYADVYDGNYNHIGTTNDWGYLVAKVPNSWPQTFYAAVTVNGKHYYGQKTCQGPWDNQNLRCYPR
jgi:hypothetical protein